MRRRRPNVEKLRRAGRLAELLEALTYREITVDSDGRGWDLGMPVRRAAARALSDFYGQSVIDGLVAALGDREAPVRIAAAEGLVELASPIADAELLALIAADSGDAAGRALELLAASPVEGLAESLVEWLVVDDHVALGEWQQLALQRLLAADSRGDHAHKAVVAQLLTWIHSDHHPDRSGRAGTLLGWLGASASHDLVAALEGGSEEPAVICLVGELRDARAVSPLVGLLESARAQVRAEAAAALGRIGDTRGVPALLGATQDPDADVRQAAGRALDGLGVAAVIGGLTAIARQDGRGAPSISPRTENALEAGSWVDPVLTRLEATADENGDPASSDATAIERGVARMLRGVWREDRDRRMPDDERMAGAGPARLDAPPRHEGGLEAVAGGPPDYDDHGDEAVGELLLPKAEAVEPGPSTPVLAPESLYQEAARRVAHLPDLELCDLHAIAVKRTSSHELERAEYWNALATAAVVEASDRSEFGVIGDETELSRRGRRRRKRTLKPLAEAREKLLAGPSA